jgi:hypothetical protein
MNEPSIATGAIVLEIFVTKITPNLHGHMVSFYNQVCICQEATIKGWLKSGECLQIPIHRKMFHGI